MSCSLVSRLYCAESLSSSLVGPDGLPAPTHGTTWLPASGPGDLAVLACSGSHPVCVSQLQSYGGCRSPWPAQGSVHPWTIPPEHRQGFPGHTLQDEEAAGRRASPFLFPADCWRLSEALSNNSAKHGPAVSTTFYSRHLYPPLMTLVNSSHLSLVSTSSLRDRSPRSSLVPRPPTPGMLKAHLGWLWVQDKELQSLEQASSERALESDGQGWGWGGGWGLCQWCASLLCQAGLS